MPLLETPRHSQASMSQYLWGHCSFLLGPGVHKVLFVPSKSLFSQSGVSSGSSMVGLVTTSSKRAYAIPRSTAARAPGPVAGHCWLYLCRRHSNTQIQVWPSLCGVSWCVQGFLCALWASLVGMGFDSKGDFTIPTVFLGLLPCPWMWGIFFWWDPTFSYWWLFSSELQCWSPRRRRWTHVFLLCHLD